MIPERIAKIQPDNLGFYIHVPFCISKCSYCDFLSFPIGADSTVRDTAINRYVNAICKEIRFLPDVETKIDSIFLGGGTPSVLSGGWIEQILNAIRGKFNVEPDAEITVECNPGTVDEAKLKNYFSAGVNRLSFGLQSLDDSVLEAISRIHTAEDFRHSLKLARETGFVNINADVIAGLPKQTIKSLLCTLEELIEEGLKHISLYSLILEEKTALERAVSQGRVILPGEEETLGMQRRAIARLESAGLHRYEISNFAQEGYQCRHNTNTWELGAYFAAGLGASSALYLEDGILWRGKNETQLDEYYQRVEMGVHANAEHEMVDRKEQMFEVVMLGLRMTKGIKNSMFSGKFGKSLVEAFSDPMIQNMEKGLLMWDGETLSMTENGLEWQNQVLLDFMNFDA